MYKKSICAIMIVFIILLTNYTTIFAGTQPQLSSDGYYLANSTGQVLISKNENKKYQPGGITKMIACLVALEKCNLTDEVTVTEESVTKAETNVSLKAGEIMTVEDLIYCAIVANASDAVKALAIHISGSEQEFVKLMNKKAKELKCKNTHFTNCTGSNDEKQYTTPADLYTLTIASINNANLNTALRTTRKTIKQTNMSDEHMYYSTNFLICAYYDNRYFYSNAQGGKSGYTPDGGYALTAFATVGNTQLIAITMGGNDEEGVSTYNDTIAMFTYAFDNYKTVPVTNSGDILYETKIKNASPSDNIILCAQYSLKAMVKVDDEDYQFETKFNIRSKIEPPIKKDEIVGEVTYLYDGKIVGTVPLVASESFEPTFMFHLTKFFSNLWGITFVRILVTALGIILILALFLLFSVMTGAVHIKKKHHKKDYKKTHRK